MNDAASGLPKPLVIHGILACGVGVGTWIWLAHATGLGLQIPLVLLADAFLILPPGVLLVAVLVPIKNHVAARVALVGLAGYLTTTLLAVVARHIWRPGALSIRVPRAGLDRRRSGVQAAQQSHRDTSRRPHGLLTGRRADRGCSSIGSLSLVALTPLMTPVRSVSPGRLVSFAYIDTYQSLAFVQGLMRHVPLAEHQSLAGIQPRVYPDFHYTYLAMVARLSGATATNVYFCHGAILLVMLGTLLAYAIGRELTGRALGGYVSAVLLYLVVVPNPYDLNLTFANESTPFMPTFYQAHFFSARYSQHEAAGGLLIMGAILGLLVSESASDRRSKIGGLILSGCFVAALSRFRSQHVLAAGPGFLLLCMGLFFARRDWRYLSGPAAFATLFGLLTVQSLGGHYDTQPARLAIDYGRFGWELLNRWYLPARWQPSIAALPTALAPAVAVVVWVGLRVIGVGLGVLGLGRAALLVKRREWPNVMDIFCAATLACGIVVSLVVRREAISIGMQTLQMGHLLAVLVAVIPTFIVARGVLDAAKRIRVPSAAVAVVALATLTFVAHRAADAALHDQQQRAYPLTAGELDAYRWIKARAPEDAVVAAHPDHRVNASGETVRTTDFLTAMTDRRVFLQRAGVDQGALSSARATELRRLFAASSPDAACHLAASLTIDYLIEYEDTPLTAREAPCLEPVFDREGMRVFRLSRP